MMAIPSKNDLLLLRYEVKILILNITIFVLAIVSGFLFSGVLYGSLGQGPNAQIFWILTAAAFLLLIVMLATVSLVIRQNIVFLVFGATTLALFLPVGEQINIWHWLAAGILFLWIMWSYWQIQNDLMIFVKPQASRILGRGIRKLISGLIIFISVFYFFSPQIRHAENLLFSRPLFKTVLVPVEKMVQGFAPEFSKDMTVDEAILKIAGGAAFDQILSNTPEFKKVPSKDIESVKKQFFEQFKGQIPKQRQELSGRLGIALEGDEKIADVFYDFSLAKFQELPAWSKTLFNIFSALTLYFILRIVAFPFSWMALILATGFLKIFVTIGIISVRKEMIEREIVEI